MWPTAQGPLRRLQPRERQRNLLEAAGTCVVSRMASSLRCLSSFSCQFTTLIIALRASWNLASCLQEAQWRQPGARASEMRARQAGGGAGGAGAAARAVQPGPSGRRSHPARLVHPCASARMMVLRATAHQPAGAAPVAWAAAAAQLARQLRRRGARGGPPPRRLGRAARRSTCRVRRRGLGKAAGGGPTAVWGLLRARRVLRPTIDAIRVQRCENKPARQPPGSHDRRRHRRRLCAVVAAGESPKQQSLTLQLLSWHDCWGCPS